MLEAKKPALEEDNTYARNFELVLRTALQYKHLFSDNERETIERFLKQETAAKTLYARMYFRRRYWYTPRQLTKYSETPDKIE